MKTGINTYMYMPYVACMHVHAIGQMGVACHKSGVDMCVCVTKPVAGRHTQRLAYKRIRH